MTAAPVTAVVSLTHRCSEGDDIRGEGEGESGRFGTGSVTMVMTICDLI